MNRSRIFSTILITCLISSVYLGCQKTDHPFGVYAPYGLDVPTATATPLEGDINVFVVENNTAVGGITIDLKDPNGNYLPEVVTGIGAAAYAPFSPSPVTTGVWQAEVYTQGHYLDSTQSFSIIGGQSSVTFTAGTVETVSPSFSSGPLNQQYQTGNGAFVYGVTYFQPGNLSIPVSVELANVLPVGFASTPATVVLGLIGTGVDEEAVTISKTACFINNVPVTFDAFDFLGSNLFNPTAFNVTRGFQIPLSVSVSGTTSTAGCGGPCSKTTINYSVNLSATGDCNHSYPLYIWATGSVPSGSETIFNTSSALINGGTYSGAVTYGTVSNQILHITMTSPIGQTTGAVNIGPTFSGTVINTSY